MTPYPEYKPTGLPWLPQIPKEWEWFMLSQLASEQYIKNTGMQESNVLSLSYGSIIRKKNLNAGLSPQDYATYQIVHPGNTVMRLTDLQNDHRSLRTGLVKETGIITSAYTCLKAVGNPDFLRYALHAFDLHKIFYGLGGGVRQSIGFKEIRSLRFPVPSPSEQAQIVRYLDAMTAKINKLIRAKKKQIALLQEQKQAIINRAVTKGLEPNAEMKDSGIDWLGKIPALWAVKDFCKVAVIRSNLVSPDEYPDYPQLSPDKIEKNTGKIVAYATVKDSGIISNNHLFFKGQLVYSKIRPLLNKVTIAPYDGLCSADMYPIESKVDTTYLLYFMLSSWFLYQIKQSGDRVKMPKINQEEMTHLQVVVPPKSEQEKVALYIQSKWQILDKMILSLQHTIDHLFEYKNSLISSVVTGQVDIRNIAVEDVSPADLVPEDNAPAADDPAEELIAEESKE